LVERTGKRGVFWGCSNYPVCRYTREPEGAVDSKDASSLDMKEAQ
jgi:ssDNA-binding Zn-finger/Zn-ribbon topoisomerase 1